MLGRIFLKPKLRIYYNHNKPDILKISINKIQIPSIKVSESHDSNFSDSYFFRFRIKNEGNQAAENVEVIINNIEKQNANGIFERYKNFTPLNLNWSYFNGLIHYSHIPIHIEKHCDLGFILNPQQKQIYDLLYDNEDNIDYLKSNVTFSLKYVLKTNVQECYSILPGKYKIELIVAASNCKPNKIFLNMTLKENWSDDFKKMISENIILKFTK